MTQKPSPLKLPTLRELSCLSLFLLYNIISHTFVLLEWLVYIVLQDGFMKQHIVIPARAIVLFFNFFLFFSFFLNKKNNIDNKTKFLNVFHQQQSVMIIWH